MFDKLSGLKKIKAEYILIAVLVIVIVFIMFSSFGSKSEESYDETEAYVKTLEQKLENSLKKIEGVGNVSVVITVKSGISSELAVDRKTITENGKTTVTESAITVGGKPVTLKSVYPEIAGVLIVAKGADNIMVKMNILDAATVVLGVDCDKIQILAE